MTSFDVAMTTPPSRVGWKPDNLHRQWRSCRDDRAKNLVQHELPVFEEIYVVKAQHAVAARLKPSVPGGIVRMVFWFSVLATVELDDEFGR